MFAKILTTIIFLCFLFSCKNDRNPKELTLDEKIAAIEAAYNETKADSSFNQLIQLIGKKIIVTEDNKEKEALLHKAINLCSSPEKAHFREVFVTEALKVNPESNMSKDYLWETGKNMFDKGKKEVAAMIFTGFKSRYAEDIRSNEANAYIGNMTYKPDSLVSEWAKRVFENVDSTGINSINAKQYVDICETYALVYPTSNNSPEYLFRASEMCRALRSFPKMLSLYEWIYQYYPDYKRAPLAMFLKGFTLESEFKNPEEAKKVFEKFIQTYPQDSLVKDATFMLENLGKTDQELLQELAKKK